MSQARSDHYTAAGVNIDAGDELVRRIRPMAARTHIPGAASNIGGFAGVFDLARAGYGDHAPRLVAGTDGVGTKVKLAFATGRHDTIGIDCVAMCVNDILVTGARPLFFLDYLATGRLDPSVGEAIVSGVVEGCTQAGCWLMGGETAEMPGLYADGEYDVAGFVVGALSAGDELQPESIVTGDAVLGVASSGLHSNGYSLARRVLLEQAQLPLDAALEWDNVPLGTRLLTPTRIYRFVMDALRAADIQVRGASHITGGGLWENPQRSLPDRAAITFSTEAVRAMNQPIFREIAERGGVPETEMYRVFNMGIGMTLVVNPSEEALTLQTLRAAGVEASRIGTVVERGEQAPIQWDSALEGA